MVEGHNGREAMFVAGRQHPPVMLQDCPGELAFLRLDACPLDREAVGVEAQLGQERNVIHVAVVVIAGIAGRLGKDRPGQVFEQPDVTVDVIALDLMGCRRCPQRKPVGKMTGMAMVCSFRWLILVAPALLMQRSLHL